MQRIICPQGLIKNIFFLLLLEARVPRENVQTPHRKATGWNWTDDRLMKNHFCTTTQTFIHPLKFSCKTKTWLPSVHTIIRWSRTVRCYYSADLVRYLSSSRSALRQRPVPSGKRRERAPCLLGSCGRWLRGECTAAAEPSCYPDPWLQPEPGGSSLKHQMDPIEIKAKCTSP